MNKTIKLRNLFVLILIATLTSCFKDDTTLGTGVLSEILIDSASVGKVHNMYQNETLQITPIVSQTNQEKELTYTWEIDLKTYSHEKVFIYKGETLGSYHCRLIVENEDGKSFYPFIVHVNTPYEEGLTVISKDADGKAMLSFMMTPPDGSAPTGFMQGDQFFASNNQSFVDNPVDMVQSGGQLIIACQGSGDETSPATIYCLNEKTFLLENLVTEPGFKDFKPTFLGIPAITSPGRSYPILCEGGHTYEFSTTEGALSEAIKLPYTYAQTAIIYTKSGGYYDFLCWDKELNALCLIYHGYPPYYCAKEYHTNRDSIVAQPSKNLFDGFDICKMVLIEQTNDVLTTPKALVITKNSSGMYQKTLISVDFWEMVDGETKLVDGGGPQMCGFGQLSLTEATPCIANRTYSSLLFADANKVRRWNYASSSDMITAAQELCSVGNSETAIITSMVLSSDHKKTYVAFYDPEQTELNGSVWVIDTDNGTVLEQYDNVCYQPVKMIYKKK